MRRRQWRGSPFSIGGTTFGRPIWTSSRWDDASTLTSPSMETTHSAVHQQSASAAKIALFRSLFRGRDDVYARRFESRKTGKSGYAPACANEWVKGICEKPRIKCAVCPHRKFYQVTDEA